MFECVVSQILFPNYALKVASKSMLILRIPI